MANVEIDLKIIDSKELVGLGIRAYAIGDFSSATCAFGRATQLMAQELGDKHDSLGEIYLHYAKALLEVSREESGPLGDAIPQGDSDSDDEEEVDQEEENGEVTSTENQEEKKDENNIDKKADEEEAKVESSIESSKPDESESSHQNGKSTDGKLENAESGEATSTNVEDKEEEKSEDCSDLQLAWEVLEVAKGIFANRGDSGKERYAETLILLGEVAMESENFVDGVNDMKAGLEIQKTLFEETSRKLAESYYKVGTAYSTISSIEEAIEHFKFSIDTLKKRIKFLEENSSEQKTDNKNEIDEIKELIPEIEEKISDTKSAKEELVANLLKEMTSNAPKIKDETATSSKVVNNISHLVKRKRKTDEDESETSEAQSAKKPTL